MSDYCFASHNVRAINSLASFEKIKSTRSKGGREQLFRNFHDPFSSFLVVSCRLFVQIHTCVHCTKVTKRRNIVKWYLIVSYILKICIPCAKLSFSLSLSFRISCSRRYIVLRLYTKAREVHFNPFIGTRIILPCQSRSTLATLDEAIWKYRYPPFFFIKLYYTLNIVSMKYVQCEQRAVARLTQFVKK